MTARLLTGWQADPVLWLLLAASAVLYLRAAARTPRWRTLHTVAWLGGLAALAVALLSGLDAEAQTSMRAHMVQHLLLVNLAAPLLVAGSPVALALRSTPRLRPPLRRALHSRALAFALHPAVAVVVLTLIVGGSHLPAIYDAALDHPALHATEHMAYLTSALLFWSAILGIRPLPRRRSVLPRVLALLIAMPPMALIGVSIMSTSGPAYRHYALADQHGAGRLMWVAGTLPMAALVMVLAASGVLEEERRQVRREAHAARRAAGGAA